MPVERTSPPPPLTPGDPAPWFSAPAIGDNPAYVFQNAAGRFILLGLIGSSVAPAAEAMIAAVMRHRPLFDDDNRAFFGLTIDPADEGRLASLLPGIRWLLDRDGTIAARYGAIAGDDARVFQPFWLVLDPMLRVAARFPAEAAEDAMACLAAAGAPPERFAPVLMLPGIFEPDLCREMIAGYEADGGRPSGFMRDVAGKTRELADERHKRRSDWTIDAAPLRRRIADRLHRRLVPEIAKAFQFQATRIERHLVACYEAEGGGWFRPHRDNTSHGTAHRRFAVTINLNAGDYRGGDLRFPEHGPRTYRAETGGAVVFSCSMLHEATPMLAGTRYAYLTFLYDDAAAAIREANNTRLGDEVGAYRRAG